MNKHSKSNRNNREDIRVKLARTKIFSRGTHPDGNDTHEQGQSALGSPRAGRQAGRQEEVMAASRSRGRYYRNTMCSRVDDSPQEKFDLSIVTIRDPIFLLPIPRQFTTGRSPRRDKNVAPSPFGQKEPAGSHGNGSLSGNVLTRFPTMDPPRPWTHAEWIYTSSRQNGRSIANDELLAC